MRFRVLSALLAVLGACAAPAAPVPAEPPAAPDPPPTTFHDGSSYWSVVWPRGWETQLAQDPEDPSLVISRGPLSKDVQGSGWGRGKIHGTLKWPEMVLYGIGTAPAAWKEASIDGKKALVYEFEDRWNRTMGCAVERGDMLIYVAIGCPKARFEEFREKLAKVVLSVKCAR
ncbi:MAG TPA: hypothetical protein VNM14_10950 [Planctomycetota bacterium]|jgi:hypothetical protein|nr:hypothetical protein [Planctomycetota bacterium]